MENTHASKTHQLQKQLLTGNRINVLQILENSRKTALVEHNFTKVAGLYSTILLKQDPTASVVLKNLQNFQNSYFHVTPLDSCFWIHQQFWEFLPPAYPTRMWREGEGMKGSQFGITCWKSSWLTMHWPSKNTLIQSNIMLTDTWKR